MASMSPGETGAPSPTPAIPRALPVEKEKKPGLLGRLFKKKSTPTPAPAPTVAPTATPKPKWKKRPKTPAASESNPTPAETDSADTNPTPNPGLVPLPEAKTIEGLPPTPGAAAPGSTPLPSSLPALVGGSVDNSDNNAPAKPNVAPAVILTPTPASTPIAMDIRNNPMNQPIPLVDDSMALQITPEVTPNPETTAAERAQFQKAKAKALEDAKLRDLKAKAEFAATPAERYGALKQYYPRLFTSMRKIDSTLEVQIDEMEAAARRRLERMQADTPNSSSH